ncbi:MAG: RNA-binding transcriptional accessory protein [Firmicutes bacterium]|nr:RNA-binding transcriptional accessory protein [Bacillota bacterium]
MDLVSIISAELLIKKEQTENAIKLIDEGNTIPFIARYRKELTGSLDDQKLRELHDRLMYLRNLEEKREQVKNSICEQEKLTPEILSALENALTLTEIEDIYRPFRPKRRTRATIAQEKGLAPLAEVIFSQTDTTPPEKLAEKYVDNEKGVSTIDEAIEGARDIIAEMISDNAAIRKMLRDDIMKTGKITSKANGENESVYEMYYDYSENIASMATHRVLALNRGEKEKFLSVKIEAETERLLHKMENEIILGTKGRSVNVYADMLKEVIADSFKRLIFPSIEREIRSSLTEKAEEKAISVFGQNLKQLLLQPPLKDKTVLAIDPAFRTGCKTAVIDVTGKPLETCVIYPTAPHNKTAEAEKKLVSLIEKHCVDVVAIGNGTAGRETEMFVAEMLKKTERNVQYTIVNEAGASVYSASKLASDEFPEYDVSLRSAVSIGRRLQDPLAELVKIDAKSIGVGQYQHDMNQKNLAAALGGVVEECVNSVGADLNTASSSLLSYIAGITPAVSKNIEKYRRENGKFKSRRELLKVAKLGPKAFEQCAGFLRILESQNPLDATGVHPESYEAAEKLLEETGHSLFEARSGIIGLGNEIGDKKQMAEKIGVGLPTLNDIIKELEKPGRDIRDKMPKPMLRSDVLSMEDLAVGMVLKGTVRNVIDFGAFVDIGVHQDGLVHISQICERYIKHPLEALAIGDIVTVKILSVDAAKKRISLTMRDVE